MRLKNANENKKEIPADFPAWKERLREDCHLQGRHYAFAVLGDHVLQLLWEGGLEPTVEAVVDAVRQDKPN